MACLVPSHLKMMLKMIHGDYFVGDKVAGKRNVAIASRIFAASKYSNVLELLQVQNLIFANYGKEFIVAAAELQPDCEVNRLIIKKLFVRAPSGKIKFSKGARSPKFIDVSSPSENTYEKEVALSSNDRSCNGKSIHLVSSRYGFDVFYDTKLAREIATKKASSRALTLFAMFSWNWDRDSGLLEIPYLYTDLGRVLRRYAAQFSSYRFMALLQPPPPSQSIGNKKQKSEPAKAQPQVIHTAESMETPVHLPETMQSPSPVHNAQEQFHAGETPQGFFKDVLPFMADLAFRFPYLLNDHFKQSKSHLVPDRLRVLMPQEPGLVYMSQELAAAILVCAFFCLYPIQGRREANLPDFNFDGLFQRISDVATQQQQKAHCIVHYFTRLRQAIPRGMLSFERKTLCRQLQFISPRIPRFDQYYWKTSSSLFCSIQIFEDGLIENQSSNALEVDFANRFLGGGVLRKGCVQICDLPIDVWAGFRKEATYSRASRKLLQVQGLHQFAAVRLTIVPAGCREALTDPNTCPDPPWLGSAGVFLSLLQKSTSANLIPLSVGCCDPNGDLNKAANSEALMQEEIRFVVCPELIAGMLFMPAMQADEAIEIRGVERFSRYTGYSSSFCFVGDYSDIKPMDSYGRLKTQIVAIDALRHPGQQQYKEALLVRETNKAFCGFLHQKLTGLSDPVLTDEKEGNSLHDISLDKNRDRAAVSGDMTNIATDNEGEAMINQLRNTHLTSDASSESGNAMGIATGNWGCGAFGGDVELKSLIQWMAASQAGRPFVHYFTFGSPHGQMLQKVADIIIKEGWLVGDVWTLLVEYGQKRLQRMHKKGLFEWILPYLLKDKSAKGIKM
ncbi:hypothetical protein L7F22_057346 [Adiantum nelumboides]|nr:hypothetical protein [Adiantum nelumboides]